MKSALCLRLLGSGVVFAASPAPALEASSPAWTVALYSIGALLVAAGLLGLVLPVLPGSPLIFLGLLAVAWADGFARIGPVELVVLGLLAALIVVVDYTAAMLGARRFGSSRHGIAGAFLGLLAGLPFGLPGVVIGPFVGAFALEALRDRDLRRASRVGAGTLIGLVAGAAVKCALAFAMLGLAAVFWVTR